MGSRGSGGDRPSLVESTWCSEGVSPHHHHHYHQALGPRHPTSLPSPHSDTALPTSSPGGDPRGDLTSPEAGNLVHVMSGDGDPEIPASGAVFTFGKSRFADNLPSHFFIRNDPIVDIACGDEHTGVVCQNGRVFTFGSNEWGQLGLGHRSSISKPTCVKIMKPMKSTNIAAGRAHTLIRTDAGLVYSCGNNSDGQLGLNDNEAREVPLMIPTLNNIREISAGSNHSAAISVSGDVYVWGSNSDGQLGLDKDVTSKTEPTKLEMGSAISQVACGYYHTVLLTEEGQIYVFGEGDSGKLGLGHENNIYSPTMVPLNQNIAFIAAGGKHTIAITDEGEALVWGSNEKGQLGLDSLTNILSPTTIPLLSTQSFKCASAGESHSAFLTDAGEVFVCGESRHGKLGLEKLTEGGSNYVQTPLQIPRLVSFVVSKVSCGGCHTMIYAAPKSDAVCEIIIENTDPPWTNKGLPPLQQKTSNSNLLSIPPDQALSPPLSNHSSSSIPYLLSSSQPVPLTPIDTLEIPDFSQQPTHQNDPQRKAQVSEIYYLVHKSCMDGKMVQEDVNSFKSQSGKHKRSLEIINIEDHLASSNDRSSCISSSDESEGLNPFQSSSWVQTCQIIEGQDGDLRSHSFYFLKRTLSDTSLNRTESLNQDYITYNSKHKEESPMSSPSVESKKNRTVSKFTMCKELNSPEYSVGNINDYRKRKKLLQKMKGNNLKKSELGQGDASKYEISSDEEDERVTVCSSCRAKERVSNTSEIVPDVLNEKDEILPEAEPEVKKVKGRISRFFSRLGKSSQNNGLISEPPPQIPDEPESNGKEEELIVDPEPNIEDGPKKSKMCVIL